MTKAKTDSTAEFSAQYKDPRWQKRRLEIFEHDKYTCQICGSTDQQLHVHHASYIKGRKVWEYDKDALLTICNDCHRGIHNVLDMLKEFIMPSLMNAFRSEGSFNLHDFYHLMTPCLFEDRPLTIALKAIAKEMNCEHEREFQQIGQNLDRLKEVF